MVDPAAPAPSIASKNPSRLWIVHATPRLQVRGVVIMRKLRAWRALSGVPVLVVCGLLVCPSAGRAAAHVGHDGVPIDARDFRLNDGTTVSGEFLAQRDGEAAIRTT